MIRGRFARRVGRVRCIGRRLREEPLVPERAEHLVRRDVQEAETFAPLARKRAPVAQGFLQDCESADDVGLNEFAGPID